MPSGASNYIQFDRVRGHTPSHVNGRIDLLTRAEIEKVANQGRDAILLRIAELDREWDLDRAVMLNFAIVGGSAFSAGVSGKKGWLYFFGVQMVFMGLHAVAGWCPPVSVFRRLHFRTKSEIEAEKFVLIQLLNKTKNEQTETRRSTKAAA